MDIRKYTIGKVMLYLCLLLVTAARAEAISGTSMETEDKIKVHESTIEEVIQRVAEYTDYKIILMGKPEMEKISGVFYLSDLETTFRRVFAGVNTFVEFDEEKKEILVKFPSPGPTNIYSQGNTYVSDTNKIDPDTGMTHAEILAMREQEREIRMARMNTPGEVDPESGLEYTEQMDIRRSESQLIQEKASDPNEIDPTTDTSYLAQTERKEHEEQEILAKADDESQIDPSTGTSYKQQLEIRESEKQERMARVSDPAAVDPESGMPYQELLERRQNEQKML